MLTFEAEEATTYRLSVTIIEGEESPLSIYIDQENFYGNSISFGAMRRFSVEFTSEVSGRAMVRFSSYAWQGFTFEVTLEVVE